MSKYLMLEDHYVNGQYLPAGTIQSTIDIGGLLPIGWIPTPNVDPLDTSAVAAFYAAGPARSGLIYIDPTTYWITISTPADFSPVDFSPVDFSTNSTSHSWGLTGLGSNHSIYVPVYI
jgi:hypothetical protein